jgi:hypothetical protein
MQHAPDPMRAFAAKREPALGITIEPRPPLDQLAHVAHAVFDQHPYRRFIAQAVAGGDRVGGVQRRGVVGAHCRGDAALRVAGVALSRIGLGEHEHVAGAREIGGGAKAGNAAADDQEVRTPRHRMLS